MRSKIRLRASPGLLSRARISGANFLEVAIAANELAATDRTFLHVATRYVKFTLENLTVMARNGFCVPVFLFISISNPWNGFPPERIR
jgi:hypothetical protein